LRKEPWERTRHWSAFAGRQKKEPSKKKRKVQGDQVKEKKTVSLAQK